MGVNVGDKSNSMTLERYLRKAQEANQDALEKLSSGTVFTKQDPRPSERAISESLEFKIRGLMAAKRQVSDASSMLQTAESAFNEVNNIVLRMKEIGVAATNTTITDRDRRYLFIEYEALHDEINRIATTTTYNGIPLLNGSDPTAPENLVFRLGDPVPGEDGLAGEDVNTITFEGFKNVLATTEGLGINSARELLIGTDDDGISVSDVADILIPQDSTYSTVFDEALARLTEQRSVFGALQQRMQRAMDFTDVYQENLAAAKSNIADTDFAKEASNYARTKILLHAATSLLAQGNVSSLLTTNLLGIMG
ncbi:MAG: flagellin [Pseudomonadota bacterium]